MYLGQCFPENWILYLESIQIHILSSSLLLIICSSGVQTQGIHAFMEMLYTELYVTSPHISLVLLLFLKPSLAIWFKLILSSFCVAQDGLKLSILLPHLPECWDDRHAPPCLAEILPLEKGICWRILMWRGREVTKNRAWLWTNLGVKKQCSGSRSLLSLMPSFWV